MKKLLSSLLCLLVLCCSIFADNNDSLLFSDIRTAFANEFYPGVVEKAGILEKDYPSSAYLLSARLMKGESLIKLCRYDEAISELFSLQKNLIKDRQKFLQITFYLGKAYYLNGEYENCIRQMYSICKAGQDGEYYSRAVYFTGCAYYAIEEYSKALLPFEYVIQNGNLYAKTQYDEVILKYVLSCNKAEQYEKGSQLLNKLDENAFDGETFNKLRLYSAQAYEGCSDYDSAYNLYCDVVHSGNKDLAVTGMKKAYKLAAENKVQNNPADIFVAAQETFEDTPRLVCEFWVRLGIDEYNENNFEKCGEYLREAQILIEKGEPYEKALLGLYQAKLLIDWKKDYISADKKLTATRGAVITSEIKNINDSYYSTFVQCKALEKKWSEIPDLYAEILVPDVQARMNYARSLYELKKYEECLNELERDLIFRDPESGNNTSVLVYNVVPVTEEKLCLYELYASVLIKLQFYEKALQIFEMINQKGWLSDSAQGEYAKVLFRCKDYEKAYEFSKKSSDLEKEYLCGLCKINTKDWNGAVNHLVNYIKSSYGTESFKVISFFYKGYAEYRTGNTRDAYATFIRYATEAPASHTRNIYLAYEFGAKAALQNGDYKSAAMHAEQMIKYTVDKDAMQNSILFCADIYATSENYEKAIGILQPYVKEHSPFAIKCLMQIARNYEKLDQLDLTEATYNKVISDYPRSEEAEEAMYRLGGVYYSRKDYVNAESRYNNYIYKYVDGKYADVALFYCADCNFKNGATGKSIMINRNLISTYPDSIYIYGACKSLLNSYYTTEDYTSALEIARYMMTNFQSQAVEDGISRNVLELEEIVSGTDRRVAEKRFEFEKQGGVNTIQGRITGTDLVSIYAAEEDGMPEAVRLAEQLLALQTDEAERNYGAKNADFLAGYYRKNLENIKAAQMYLKAAEYYRSSSESKERDASAALYGAIEAFKAAGADGDAAETAEVLAQLYPDSIYASRGKELVK